MKKSIHCTKIYYKLDRKLSDCGEYLYVKRYKNKLPFLDIYKIEENPGEPSEFYDYVGTMNFSKIFWKNLRK